MSRSVAILGPGLIGGSLAMAMLRGPLPWNVSVWTRREESVPVVSPALPGCSVSSDLKAALSGADIVVVCTPPQAIENSGDQLAGLLPAATPVTDAGSVKVRIVKSLEASLGGRFIGAHPMAGSEQSGISAARADLFDGAACILTPTRGSDSHAKETVREFWKAAGCRISEMSPEEHDAAVARISHLPHAAAAALVHAVLAKDPGISALSGSGYRDTTRVALGPEALWREIFLDNRDELVAGIADLQVHLEALKNALKQRDGEAIEAFLSLARTLRSQESTRE